ncbi:MAG: DUF1476 domain-containing protein [Pseudomonadota bacterium]
MTTFDDREQAFEKKFAHDAELKFKSEARRNKLLGAWVAGKLGLSGDEAGNYVKSVVRADLQEPGDEDVFRKIRGDFDDKAIAISDVDIRKAMVEHMEKAITEIEAERKA